MRRLIFFIAAIALGALFGLLSAAEDDWPTRVVVATIGAVFGAAIGGAAAKLCGARRSDDHQGIPVGLGMSGEDLAANYWRDKGRPQLSSAFEPEHGHKQFDSDKI